MASSLGLEISPSGKNGRYYKEDYINPIREFYLVNRYKSLDKIPEHLKLALKLKSPMLAKRIDALKPELQKVVWESDEWYFEEKLNGCRIMIVKTNEGIRLYSRHNSVSDLLPIEYSDNIVFPSNFDLDKVGDNFILDTEITSDTNRLNTIIENYGVVTETQLQAVTALLGCDSSKARTIQEREGLILTFNVFDCIYYNGQWLMNEPLHRRRTLALELWKKLEDAGFKIRPVRSSSDNKRQFYKNIILEGGEGVVSKNVNGIYVPDTSRNNTGWIKIKRSVKEIADMDSSFGDTIDGWISGFEPGKPDKGLQDYVGTIKVSCYVCRKDGFIYEHEIANISGFDMNLRKDMTENVGGIPTLKASYYGRIVEIDGQGISSRNRRLQHAVLLDFRYDKNKDSCVIEEDFLEKQIV